MAAMELVPYVSSGSFTTLESGLRLASNVTFEFEVARCLSQVA
jgi:hypothetical protein